MKQKTYLQISAVIFSVVAAAHGLRLLNGWQIQIGALVVPVWVSWIGMPVGVFLAYHAIKFSNKK